MCENNDSNSNNSNRIELIYAKEFLNKILDTIQNQDEFDKLMQSYECGSDNIFRLGFMAGMSYSGVLTTKYTNYFSKNQNEDLR